MKKTILSISIIILFSIGLNAQKKDSIPPTIPKRYVFILDSAGYSTVDSILRLSMQVAGYELKTKDSDGVKQGLAMIISWMAREKELQSQQPINKPKK